MAGDATDPSVLTPPVGADVADTSAQARRPALAIVGIGASAGGLKAVGTLLADLPADTGMGFVVIQHLDPNHDSLLAVLLAKSSHLTIEAAVDGAEVRPNRVYVITPNTSVRIERGILRTCVREAGRILHLCIDVFFQSLAADQPGNAIAVILSGTGTDGTIGLAAIKAAGGITFAQDETAEHSGMPRSAISGGHVDFVLKPAEIAVELAKIAQFGFPAMPTALDTRRPEAAAHDDRAHPAEDPEHYAIIIDRLRTATGVDFTGYRSTTIMRRTQRRMALTAKATLADYARSLDEVPEEVAALARDILIHVTSFYRDHGAFEALRTSVFPALMRDREANAPLRVWVVGCSTGQEVCSLAIELVEHLRGTPDPPHIQIFATDISDWALAKARIGWYPESIGEVVPADRLARYFTRDESGFRINKDIRALCVFAKHDVTAHIPFSRIDLITCRNVLIYLGATLQQRVLPTFHFALKPGGFLLLGSSESVGRGPGLYETIDEKNRVYRAVPSRGRRQQPRYLSHPTTGDQSMPPIQPSRPSLPELQRAADQIVLNRFTPAGVLITDAMDILQLRGHTSPYLELPQGEPNLNLLTMVPFGVAGALREAVNEARQQNAPVRREGVMHRRGSSVREITFEIIPVKPPASTVTCYLVLFEDKGTEPATGGPTIPAALDGGQQTLSEAVQRELVQLRQELAAAGEHIRSLVDQVHGLTEQLSVSQEESQSNSEEYRSTNEELQTAKEEVESTNEELVTINDELRSTNEELDHASSALRVSGELTSAIVETMRYPLLLLDQHLRVESANQAFLNAFRVSREESIGKLVYELGNAEWNIPDLRRLLEDILPNHSAFDDFEVSHDFRAIGRRTMLLNARRLKGADDQPRLIVLMIADVTEQARFTENLKELSDDLLRSNAELDQFAAVASHDLQEPLRMMTSYISLLQRQYGSLFDDRAKEYMAYVTEGAQRMTAMIKGILAYSRLGHEAADVTSMDSSRALKNALVNLKGKIEIANATIVDGALPQVRANHEQIMQLFQNLVSNALKFRSEERSCEIRVTAAESPKEWTFAVADNGIGMEPGSEQKIFQLFQRLHGRKVPGTGIGLATCKKIVEHHGGRIWVESRAGVGSTFYFTLPK